MNNPTKTCVNFKNIYTNYVKNIIRIQFRLIIN